MVWNILISGAIGAIVGALIGILGSIAVQDRHSRSETYHWLLGASRSLPQLTHAYLEADESARIYFALSRLRHKEGDEHWAQVYQGMGFNAMQRGDNLTVEIAHMNHNLIAHVGRAQRLFVTNDPFHKAREAILQVTKQQITLSDASVEHIDEANEQDLKIMLGRASRTAGDEVDRRMEQPLVDLCKSLEFSVPGRPTRDD